MLFVSGELNPSVGGIPCRPHLNREVAFQPRQIMGGTASVYEPDPLPAQRNRRTLYTEKIRGLRDPFLEVFNQPGPDKPCELRETSIISPQALTLINSGATHSRAIAFAERLMREARPPHAQRKDMSRESNVIDRAFQLAFTRQPSKPEMELCLAHWRAATADEMNLHHEPVEFPAQIVRTVTAEKTGEPYDFVELLPAHQDYQADLQLSDIDAETRGLAHVLRILLNTNEFIYLD